MKLLRKKIFNTFFLAFLSICLCRFNDASAVSPLNFDAIAQMKYNAFSMMDQLEGWCSHDKASILMDLILNSNPDVIVEIGVFGGKSLIPMAYALKTIGKGLIYGIDPWDSEESIRGLENPVNKNWWGHLDHSQILRGLIQKMHDFDLIRQIQLIQDTSINAYPIPNIDILHIDGNHSEQASYQDVLKWAPLVKKGGWIIFDDINWVENGYATTAAATQWLDAHCMKFGEYQDPGSTWGIWIKQ
jgi:predicted O-methyltransferase YrrM